MHICARVRIYVLFAYIMASWTACIYMCMYARMHVRFLASWDACISAFASMCTCMYARIPAIVTYILAVATYINACTYVCNVCVYVCTYPGCSYMHKFARVYAQAEMQQSARNIRTHVCACMASYTYVHDLTDIMCIYMCVASICGWALTDIMCIYRCVACICGWVNIYVCVCVCARIFICMHVCIWAQTNPRNHIHTGG